MGDVKMEAQGSLGGAAFSRRVVRALLRLEMCGMLGRGVWLKVGVRDADSSSESNESNQHL